MERVTGIGGVFFRSKDPEALTRWYEETLGVTRPPASYDESPWWQEAGPTVWAPMSADSGHLDNATTWSINFRVSNLDAMVAQLREAGLEVSVDSEIYPNGRFAPTPREIPSSCGSLGGTRHRDLRSANSGPTQMGPAAACTTR